MLSEYWVVVLRDPLLDFGGTVSCGECVWIQGFGGLDNGGQFWVLKVKRLRWH